MKVNYIDKKIKNIRKKIASLSYAARSAHLGSSLSCVEILTACMLIKKENKKSITEIILSKGHAAMAYYSVLNEFGEISDKSLKNYMKPNSNLWGHVTKSDNQFFKFSFGSLGYGLGISCGLTLGYESIKKKHNIYCIISDGEINEGSTWEALMFISHHQLNNIKILIDKNSIQSLERTEDVINLKKLDKIFSNFDFDVSKINGHDIKSLIKLLKKKTKKPSIIICNTIKGKGIKEIEDKITSHYYPATYEQFKKL
jgi:transketolase